jgi:hypothetical protein
MFEVGVARVLSWTDHAVDPTQLSRSELGIAKGSVA